MAEEVVRTGPAYGPGEGADDTRQAQMVMANDMTLDVNINSVIGRSQAQTFDQMGKNFEANADRRSKIADAYMGRMLGDATKS